MRKNLFFSLLPALLLFFSCSDDAENSSDMGRLNVQMVDAPFPFDKVAEANVTVFKIDARLKGDSETDLESMESEENGSTYITLMEEEIPLNLLELVNGTTAMMADVEVPVGTYDLVRVYVKGVNVLLTDGTSYGLKVPSGAQTGIKVFIKPGIKVVGGISSDLLLDFDVSRSFVAKGNSRVEGGIKGFNFKPVIKASNSSTAGTLAGKVTTVLEDISLPLEGAEVKVFNETDTTTTFTDIDGRYMIMGLEAGTYNTAALLDGYVSSDTLEVAIVAANKTLQDFMLEVEMESVEEGN
ncbi:DUF4382 domain-containing protein [Maribacter aestuarii]|uniref:DUF4382 domain-containing protein n=1 Tax=Maribacter aestuarii TaxID=1130723 RepID=UPI0025A55CC1|nr:DUF4382 domain-containing protein [Maribacter aestuarii]